MRRRMGLVLLLVVVLLGASVTVQAATPRGVTGGIDFEMFVTTGPEVTDGMLAITSAILEIHEVNPETHEARGLYRWWVKSGGLFDQLAVDVTAVQFLDGDPGDPAEAIFCGKVIKMIGWPEVLQDITYFKLGVLDGGPGGQGDAIATYLGNADAGLGYHCDPCMDPTCPDIDIHLPWMPVMRGDITIHR